MDKVFALFLIGVATYVGFAGVKNGVYAPTIYMAIFPIACAAWLYILALVILAGPKQ